MTGRIGGQGRVIVGLLDGLSSRADRSAAGYGLGVEGAADGARSEFASGGVGADVV